MPCGFGSENSDMLSTVATGDEIQDLLHFKNDGQLKDTKQVPFIIPHQK